MELGAVLYGKYMDISYYRKYEYVCGESSTIEMARGSFIIPHKIVAATFGSHQKLVDLAIRDRETIASVHERGNPKPIEKMDVKIMTITRHMNSKYGDAVFVVFS